MTIFARRKHRHKNPPQQSAKKNALPGVFALFERTHHLARQEKQVLAGYTAWVFLPTLIEFCIKYLPPLTNTHALLLPALYGTELVLLVFMQGCMFAHLLKIIRPETVHRSMKECERHVANYLPQLMMTHLFIIGSIVVKIFPFILPALFGWATYAFAPIVLLDFPNMSQKNALIHSAELTKSRKGMVTWRLLGGHALLFLLTTIVIAFCFLLVSLVSPSFFSWPPHDLMRILMTALILPILPYSTCYIISLYEALKKE